jgi:hypothetical protein
MSQKFESFCKKHIAWACIYFCGEVEESYWLSSPYLLLVSSTCKWKESMKRRRWASNRERPSSMVIAIGYKKNAATSTKI